MSSGIGAFGGVGRCYDTWVGYAKCMNSVQLGALCGLQREDYMECLHRKKTKRRVGKLMFAQEVAKDGVLEAPTPKQGHH